jgi:hypothetical protein
LQKLVEEKLETLYNMKFDFYTRTPTYLILYHFLVPERRPNLNFPDITMPLSFEFKFLFRAPIGNVSFLKNFPPMLKTDLDALCVKNKMPFAPFAGDRTVPATAPCRRPHRAGERTVPANALCRRPHCAGDRTVPATALCRRPHYAGDRTCDRF